MDPDAGPEQRPDSPRRWLCRTEMERARFADMNDRVRTARRVQAVVLSASVLLGAPTFGWRLVAIVVFALLIMGGLEVVPERTVSQERASALSMAVLIIVFGAGILFSGGVRSPYLAFIAIPSLMLAARFRLPVVAVGQVFAVVVGVLCMRGAAVLHPVPLAPWWVMVAANLAMIVALAAIAVTLLSAELQSRGDAVVDPLTGLFNRKALAGRFAEAVAQARVLDGPVSVVLCDLDHFKDVNDQHGHDRGDVVLREAAYRMRKTLRTFDLVYRIGGEEFLVLLPGQDSEAAARVAERMVVDLAAEPLGGLPVTMSAGVASGSDDELVLESLIKRADVALYAAKHAGRNRCCVDGVDIVDGVDGVDSVDGLDAVDRPDGADGRTADDGVPVRS